MVSAYLKMTMKPIVILLPGVRMKLNRLKADALIELADTMTQVDVNNIMKGRYDQAQLARSVIVEVADALRSLEHKPQPLKLKR